ncbi:MAG: hypothetical protein OSJ73_14720 [Lachnospiraceae bacterium]|nr:hypothetical protein [Lachnospiraceae bacterium]HBV82230.1 hypothetical protein [Lachnospiraceae bacterium]
MNFMWDIALRAFEQGWDEQDLIFMQAKEYSPFYEQSFPCINEKKVHSNEIELNLLYRFADIFQEILAPESLGLEEQEYTQFSKYFIDAVLHAILYTDLRCGITKREIYIHKILEELQDGTFWKGTVYDFNIIDRQKQGRFAALVLSQMEIGSSLQNFRKGILILYPEAMLYQIKKEPKKLLLYIRCPKSDIEEHRLQFVQDMFLPIGFELRVFWQYHFGIIGAEGTMKLDEVALY